jgi:hypothetical protein
MGIDCPGRLARHVELAYDGIRHPHYQVLVRLNRAAWMRPWNSLVFHFDL